MRFRKALLQTLRGVGAIAAESIRHDEYEQAPGRAGGGFRAGLRHKSEAKARRVAGESHGRGTGFAKPMRSGIGLNLEAGHDPDADPDFCLRPRTHAPGGGLGCSRGQGAELCENAQCNRFDPDPAWHCPCLPTLVRGSRPLSVNRVLHFHPFRSQFPWSEPPGWWNVSARGHSQARIGQEARNRVAMISDTRDDTRQMLKDALGHFQSGLDLLDHAGAPGQIGAHVDLAINQLESAIAGTVERSGRSEPVSP